MDKRRLVVCFDGTWNTPDKGINPTNVVKMVRAVRNRDADGISQVTFYDKGVGTAGGTDTIEGGMFGVGLMGNVVDGYRFLANNHEPEDEIYIFGFSRGAYTARSLAGLIGLAGLLDPEELGGGLKRVLAIYQRTDLDPPAKAAAIAGFGLAGERGVRIRCVGVWDTVGALGIPFDLRRLFELRFRHGKYSFHDVELGSHIDVALHALAIDEKRLPFAPTLWASATGRPANPNQVVEQVWFAGAHSNVGGSYDDCRLSDIAFAWMVGRVSKLTGLALDPDEVPAVGPPGVQAPSIDSRTLLYQISRRYPFQRVIHGVTPPPHGFGGWFRETFPRLAGRYRPPAGQQTVNEMLHVSVLERWNQAAVPNECRDGASACPPSPYRPVTLAAVIAARRGGRTMPVVGWDGKEMTADVPWPQSAAPPPGGR